MMGQTSFKARLLVLICMLAVNWTIVLGWEKLHLPPEGPRDFSVRDFVTLGTVLLTVLGLTVVGLRILVTLSVRRTDNGVQGGETD